MEIQEIKPIQTICLNGKKFWRAFDVAKDCFRTFAELPFSSQLRASSENFLLITDETEGKAWLFERKDGFYNLVFFNGTFMQPLFGNKEVGFFIFIEMPEKNLLVCEENIFECKSYNVLDNNVFTAKIVKNGEEKTLEAWFGYTKQLFYKIS